MAFNSLINKYLSFVLSFSFKMSMDSSSDFSKYELTILDGEPDNDPESSILLAGEVFVLAFCFIYSTEHRMGD